MTAPLLLLLLLLSLLLIGFLCHRIRKQQQIKRKKEQARREAEQGLVPCFTCGMKIPREGALEKKGRYFCGVKKRDREAIEYSNKTTG